MIRATGEHGATINDLAAQGKISPVAFTTSDGVRREANSVWAATDWLKAYGAYRRSELIIWHFEDPHG